MNPAIRTAIIDGLTARPAWDGIDLFRYPPGDLAEDSRRGFALGQTTGGQDTDVDLSGAVHQREYTLAGLLWWSGTPGAKDDDYATVETATSDLIADLVAWLRDTAHGKGLGVGSLDRLDVDSWTVSFTAEPAAIVELNLFVREFT